MYTEYVLSSGLAVPQMVQHLSSSSADWPGPCRQCSDLAVPPGPDTTVLPCSGLCAALTRGPIISSSYYFLVLLVPVCLLLIGASQACSLCLPVTLSSLCSPLRLFVALRLSLLSSVASSPSVFSIFMLCSPCLGVKWSYCSQARIQEVSRCFRHLVRATQEGALIMLEHSD